MRKKINRSVFWAELFVHHLAISGLNDVVISPGSRSTPLTSAFASHKKIKSHIIIDERSAGFFALGLAKSLNKPVAVVTTSGTAVAELYPSIIEAYQSRIPLIICTADRPPGQRNCGTNQTINQDNIFVNHIRKFIDTGLPSLSMTRLKFIGKTALYFYQHSNETNRGPVHLNFPFEKPLEPNLYTDEIDIEVIKIVKSKNFSSHINHKRNILEIKPSRFNKLISLVNSGKTGLIICGPDAYSNGEINLINKLSIKTSFPIYADGLSGMRFGENSKKNLINNFNGLLKSKKFCAEFKPRVIIQFGRTPTSAGLLEFFRKSEATKALVNENGDLFDPSKTRDLFYKMKISDFCSEILKSITTNSLDNPRKSELTQIVKYNEKLEGIKSGIISNAKFPFEGRIIQELISALPKDSNLMVSNSLPVRDFDNFAPCTEKNIRTFFNRGASGIDGITSTALGIASSSKTPTILLTGDLAFFHDLTGLHISYKYGIPLKIVLINNQGGGIFEALPIAENSILFENYFKTPHGLNFGKIAETYRGRYFKVKSWKDFSSIFRKEMDNRNLSIIEIQTDAQLSHKQRSKYWIECARLIDKQYENTN